MYVNNYSPPSLSLLPVHRIIKSILIVLLELVQNVLRSSLAKLVIFFLQIIVGAISEEGIMRNISLKLF